MGIVPLASAGPSFSHQFRMCVTSVLDFQPKHLVLHLHWKRTFKILSGRKPMHVLKPLVLFPLEELDRE